MITHALMLVSGTVGDRNLVKGAVVPMDAGQIADLDLIGWARAATGEEIDAAKRADAAPIAPDLLPAPAATADEPVPTA